MVDKYAIIFPSPDLPPPSLGEVGARSITLNWDEPPPELTSELPRNITQFAVTLTPRDGGDPITVYTPAEAGTSLDVPGLTPETEYDIEVMAVIDTEGQGEETYDLGIPILTVNTGKFQYHDVEVPVPSLLAMLYAV